LPKPIRRELGPAPDRAAALDSALGAERTALLPALERQIRESTGVIVTREDWQVDQVPSHLRPRFVVEDDQRRVLASGRDLHVLRQEQAAPVREVLAEAVGQLERSGVRTWDFGPLPQSVRATHNGAEVVGYPSLVDEAGAVAVRVLPSAGEQQAAMRAGTVRLLRLNVGSPVRAVLGPLDPRARLALGVNPDGTPIDLAEDCADAVTADLLDANGGVAWDAAHFVLLVDAVRTGLVPGVAAALRDVRAVLDADRDLDQYLSGDAAIRLGGAAEDLRRQRQSLLHKGFVADIGRRRLPDLARYLQAMAARAERLPREAQVDAVRADRVHLVEEAYAQVRARVPDDVPEPPELADVRWMIEELRVSLFAQRLRTAYPISEQRIYRVLDGIDV
jgi:ATP-dependent helicase HrpA